MAAGRGKEFDGSGGGQSPRLRTVSNVGAIRPPPSPPVVRLLLDDEEAAALFGIGVRKLLELQHEPWFPVPVILGPRCKKHVRAELEAAIANMPRPEKPVAEPQQLLRGRVEKLKRDGVPA